MAPAQMALPVDRRNGASAPRPAPAVRPAPAAARPVEAPPVEVEDQAGDVSAAADAEGQAVEQVQRRPVQVDQAVPVWVRRVTTGAVVSVALVAAIASYE